MNLGNQMNRMIHFHPMNQMVKMHLVTPTASKDQVNDKTIAWNEAFCLVLASHSYVSDCVSLRKIDVGKVGCCGIQNTLELQFRRCSCL
jgi:hypothetical protein